MSGSYLALKQQINQILALTIANGGGGSQNLEQVLTEGADAAGLPITGLSSLESSGTLDLQCTELKINDSAGLATNVLTSQGPGLPAIWAAGGTPGTPGIQAVLEENNESTLPLLIVSDENNYTELMHDPATLVGLTVRSEFFGTKTATLASNTLTITDVQAPNTTTAELGYRLDLNLVNGAAETQRCLYDTNSINFLSNVAAADINTLYNATGMTSNQNCVLDAPLLTIPGQASFSTPPHSVEAVNGNDLVTKGYVDSLVGQYSGGYNLFFNYSVDDGIYKSLGGSVVAAAQQSVLITTDGTEQVVASFVSGELGVAALPAGIWNALIYGQVDNAGGTLTYFFELLQLTGATETLIVRSANSSDVDSLAPAAYTANAAITAEYPLALTDKIVIRIYAQHSGTGIGLTTYFQNVYYSFSQSTLNAGTTLLGSNNTWTGLNTFVLPATTPTNPTPAADSIVNYGDIVSLVTEAAPGLGAVLAISTDGSGNNMTNIGALSVNSAIYVNPGAGAPYSQLLNNGLDFRPAAGDYPNSHMDINYLSLDSAAGNYARLANQDTPRLALNTPTRGLELSNSGLYVGPGFGTSGQVLTRTAVDNEFEWADVPAPPTPEPIVSTLDYYLTTALNPGFQYPPAQPSATIVNTYQYYGWAFTNAVALRKIDWYFPPSRLMLVSDILGLYMNFFNVTTTDPQALPFISVYTKPTGSGDVLPGFAHSVMAYSTYQGVPSPTFLPAANSPYCAFMNKSGSQPTPFAYQNQVVPMQISPVPNNPRGDYLPTEEVAYIAVGTNSTSPVNQVNFVMAKVGVCLATGNNEFILNPSELAVTPTLSQVLTSGSAAGSKPISGVTTLTATTLSAPTLDASAALNVGASTALGVNVGRSGQTTDLLGNVRVNGSSGTSGQVLTSTGASTAPTWQAASSQTLAQTLTAGSTANMSINMGTFGLTACASVDAAAALALGGTTATSSALGRTGQTTDLLGNVRVNGSSGSSGQILTSTGAATAPTWQAAPAGGSQTLAQTLTLGSTANMGIDMGGFGLTNTSAVDASGAVLTLAGTTATSVILGKAAQTTNVRGNVQLNGVATAGLVYSTGTTLACAATIPIVGLLSFTKASLPTFRIDPTNLNAGIYSTTTSNSCAMFPDQMQFKDASGNTALFAWARDGPTTSVFTITPYTTTELKKATRFNGSASGFVYQNASGYTPTQLVTATTGNAFLADGTLMNNNAIVWITPTAGTLAGRTFRLWTLRTEYVDCYRVSIRNDSGVTWTIIPTGAQIIYGNVTLLSGTTLNYAGIVDNFGVMSYINV